MLISSSVRPTDFNTSCVPSPGFGGSIVVNLAVLERTQEAYRLLKRLGLGTELTQVNSSRGKEMADGAVRLESLNPVFIVSARVSGGRGD